jgi:hypothetical protein
MGGQPKALPNSFPIFVAFAGPSAIENCVPNAAVIAASVAIPRKNYKGRIKKSEQEGRGKKGRRLKAER